MESTNACQVTDYLAYKLRLLTKKLDEDKLETVVIATECVPQDAEIIHGCVRTYLREQQ